MTEISREEYDKMLSAPLEEKILYSKELIRCWYDAWSGDVYVAISGGKDSTVLLDLVRTEYPHVQAMFANTGLKYPENLKIIHNTENVVTIRPRTTFEKVIDKYGYPVVSKSVADKIEKIRRASPKNENTVRLYLEGYDSKGNYRPKWMLPKKWKFLIDAPFKISEKCCYHLKKGPLRRYNKYRERGPIVGMTGLDSTIRKSHIRRRGCNFYDSGYPMSLPLSFWKEEDVWEYIKDRGLEYSKVYDMGYDRTGCMFCMFGVHMEDKPNRFQLMKETHPKHWSYCMNKLGLKEVLDYIGEPYE
ncbi:MAG: phosphoadenosine phosphosulfate reductase family protein [Candidatus Korarchaeota archaeon]|nr:phosphoadenosine phosphosulfate reductase family protein [Candidatus Korarchaeota archaeon]